MTEVDKDNKNIEINNTDKKLHISDVSVSDLFGNCDYCKNKRYIGIYGKPCVVRLTTNIELITTLIWRITYIPCYVPLILE